MVMKYENDYLDRLGEMFEMQSDLQRNAYDSHPGDMETNEQKIQFIKDMVMALQDELHEALFETGWKPWATSRHINEAAFKAELVDAWHFFMNLCLAVDMTPDELYQGYINKHKKNEDRQEQGYDGVTGKCFSCHRAYDDDAVNCLPAQNDKLAYCIVNKVDSMSAAFPNGVHEVSGHEGHLV